jgi:MerR family transcriptional regulator, copper efflux regulator
MMRNCRPRLVGRADGLYRCREREWAVRIGKAAKESGISAKMIRYYESIGLVPRAERLDSGYREYSSADIKLLRLIRRARDAGLSPERTRELLQLWLDDRAENVKAAKALVTELEARAAAAGELAKLLRARRARYTKPRRPRSKH